MKSKLLLRTRRHVLTRPRQWRPEFPRREPVSVTLRRLRKADAWVQRFRGILEVVK
jgi:hypothetical protein